MRSKRSLLAVLLVVLASLTAGTTLAAGSESLERGIAAYWAADFETADAELTAASSSDLEPSERLSVHQFRAMCAMARGRDADAMVEFDTLLGIDPAFQLDPHRVAPPILARFEEAQFRLVDRSFGAGRDLYGQGRHADAATQFDAVLRIDPLNEFARAYLNLARTAATD